MGMTKSNATIEIPAEITEMVAGKSDVSAKLYVLASANLWRVTFTKGSQSFTRWVGYINDIYACVEKTKAEAASSLEWLSKNAAHHFTSKEI